MSVKVVMIAGASRGIGAATARAFAAGGARVALLARDGGAVAALAQDIGPERALPVVCDIARPDEAAQAVSATWQAFGRLDVVVINAGVIGPIAPLATADAGEWAQAVDINLKGPFNLIRAALPPMLAQGGGTFLHLSSGAAHSPREGWSAYCASKAGALMLVRALHLEYGGQGIRALALSPGTVATDMQRAIRASGVNEVSRLPWSAHVPPEWPARALVWMAGPGGDAHRGQELSLRDAWLREAVGLT
ncbi:MAG: SDR family NAD(P)-dependent oxidoreductase [Rubellimicrobium sp.]|nr:SDR family NAD(P)-dependent oxidoreductase [Rubellimicrobium sp.]